jgi:hypothetical protein
MGFMKILGVEAIYSRKGLSILDKEHNYFPIYLNE